ncbi:hypothetical protein GCM10007967_33580 [Xylanimonas ulmi]|uniref:Uncharacterized protein n=1 Tax=Xylanimonas ulmi TaxID=228973 RepID=A0A4Q7M340_9MICO|nr:hypothetical protein EV386_0584 [Xylanibacterium ulmi]
MDKSAYGPNGEYLGAGGGGAAGAFGQLIDPFQPSQQHLTAERERQRLDIVQHPATGGPNGEIDLDSGVAIICAEPTS